MGWIEGISLLLLLFVAMPLKYVWGIPEATKSVGMIHGLLFLAYCFVAYQVKEEANWPIQRMFTAWLLSCIPFGTFIFERKYLKGHSILQ